MNVNTDGVKFAEQELSDLINRIFGLMIWQIPDTPNREIIKYGIKKGIIERMIACLHDKLSILMEDEKQ
jgi:hypothetical protein